MNRALLSRTTGGLAALCLFTFAGSASAKIRLDGLITWGNGLGDLRYNPTLPDPGVMSGPSNDLSVAPLPGFNGLPGVNDFKPAQSSIANGDIDNVASIGYPDANPCNSCGATQHVSQVNVCYRGAVDPHDAVAD